MTKLFADLELKKQKMEEAESKERKRQREQEEALELKTKKEKEWKEEWEVPTFNQCHLWCHQCALLQAARTQRVDSWRNFQQKGSKKSKTKGLKPPKLKQEKR